MPPKRRDRESESKNGRVEHFQSDHELFLQAFEKPTQIYRYLRTRNMISPVFLHRNLTYMKDRSTRSNKVRSSFKVDSLLGTKLKQRNEAANGANIWLGDYMTLMFLGFFDKTIADDVVEVETYLSKISHKKRKDSFKALQERMGISMVKINPDDTTCPSKIPAVSVPTENFKPNGATNKSYIIQLNVTVVPNYPSITNSNNEDGEPNAKRLKSCSQINYESELVVFDKQSRCLLSEGEYELALQERYPQKKNYSPKKHPTWENIPDASIDSMDEKHVNPFDDFQKCPVLKFRLAWTKEKCDDLVDRPLPITVKKPADTSSLMQKQQQLNNKENNQPDQSQYGIVVTNTNSNIDINMNGGGAGKMQIVYQFIYNNNSRQQTEASDDFHCPWCSLNCMTLYSLLKHLKLCHARFNFTYVPTSTGARIDVSINELYDGSYTGSPHDLVGPDGFAFSRAGPARRSIVTRILVCRPRRQKPSLTEFLEIDENELNSQRPYITGHNRLYHHTMTCLPVHPKELDIDSEGESDPAWLQHKTMMMIDEFTDVNEGEKELMKMWNLHIMRNGYVGDIQIPLACDMFIDMKGKELLKKNLYKNFVMHMCNLSDYGLVSPEVQYKTIQKLQCLLSQYEEGRKVISDARHNQKEHWIKFGLDKQKTQQKLHEQQQKKNDGPDSKLTERKNAIDNSAGGSSGAVDAKGTLKATPIKKETKKFADNNVEDNKFSTGMVPLVKKSVLKSATEDPSNGRRKTSSYQQQNGNSSSTNSKEKNNSNNSQSSNQLVPSVANKRRYSHLRESPPRRRSAGASLLIQNSNGTTTTVPPNRRNSLAAIGSMTSRKRMSLTLTKVDNK